MKKEEPRQKGSALLLAMAATILLFIIGFGFLLQTQHDKRIVSNLDDWASLDRGVEAVIEQINKVLVEDLFDEDDNLLGGDGTDDSAEAYDYPGDNDPWLATLEPEKDGSGDFYWRQITDLYGTKVDSFDERPSTWAAARRYYSPEDRDNFNQWDSGQAASDPFLLEWGGSKVRQLRIRIVGEEEGTETVLDSDKGGDWDPLTGDPEDVWLWGAQADADGDGVADSRWVRIPNLSGPAGQNVYTAVRIIDNCGMINVNTAYRNPAAPPPAVATTGKWDGSRLSHVNLAGIRAVGDVSVSVTEVQLEKYGEVKNVPGSPDYLDPDKYDNDEKYDDDVSRRFLNPAVVTDSGDVYSYAPFDIGDELELRNRYFLSSPVRHRLGSSFFILLIL